MGCAPGPSEGRLKRSIIRVGQLALTVLVTWFIADRVGLSLDALRGVEAGAWMPNPGVFLVSCLLLALGYGFSAALWGRMVSDLGGPSLPVATAVRVFMVANLGRYLPGKVWQIAGLAMMARKRGVPAGTATGAAVLGQGIALVAATLVGLGAIVGGPPSVRGWGLPAAVVLVVGTAIGLLPPVFQRAMALWFRLARQEVPAGLGTVHAVRWLLLYTVNWGLYAFSFWVLAASFGYRGDVVPVASSFAAAYVLGYVAVFAPAGIGVREGALVALLTPFFGVGPAGLLAVVSRLWTTVVELVPAGAFWIGTMAENPRDANGEETAGD